MAFTLKPSKISRHGKRAALLPLFIFLLVLIPSLRDIVAWGEMIFTDVLFSFSPIIRPYVSSLKMPDHPVTVIYKDQTFFSRFGRDPNRSDFAAIADFLNNSKVNTVVFDYIFDQPSNTEDDKRFSQSLASITFPVLAQHFTSRGSGTFESRTIVDENASRPQPPLPLFSGISDYSAATGLINMAGGFDSTIRFVPLAFLPAESDEFLLTLGYTSWIASLIADKKEDIRAIALDLNESPKIIIEQVLSKGPYRYRTTGHSGVDKATRKLEIQLIKRLLEINESESFDYIETPTTWLNMPESPLPIIGSYEIPCIRLNFTKESFPFSGDGIVTKSMGTLLESEADKLSPLFADKMKLKITDDCDFLSLPILAESKTGKKEIKGKISYYDGSAVSGAEALLLMPSAATWQKTITDTKGNYSFSNLYGGDFLLYLTVRTSNGWISCSTKKYFGSEDVIEMSDVLIPRPVERVCANTEKIASSAEKICVFGEPIILIKTQKDGRTGIYEISDDYELIRYDDGSNVILVSSGEALGEQGAVLKETELAMLPKTNEWVTGFYATEQISYSNKVIEIGGLPTSLDTRLALLGKSATAGGQNTVDAVIMPANQTVIDELPEPTKENSHVAGVKFLSRDKDDYVVRLIDDKFREIVGSTGSLIKLFSGSYFVLLENSKRRIFWQDSQIQTDAVFLGSAAQTDQDFVVTPINFMDMSFTRLPGVNLHANLYSALRRQCFIRPIFFHPDSCRNFWPLIQFLLLSPILIILNQIYTNKGAIIGGISIVICSALLFIFAVWGFILQISIPFLFPFLILVSFGLSKGYISWLFARQQENETRATFGRFISPTVVNDILKTPGGLKTKSEKKELTVIFTDLAGFTSISEKLSPEALTELMNEYFEEMTKILFEHGGTLDKYIGDAIMGFWNHPREQLNHAQLAVECAIAMQIKLAELRDNWIKQGLPSVRVRAGINSAFCMVGFVGSDIQMNFTCLGDGVNLASRLEGANKNYGTYIMISDSVHWQIDCQKISTRFLDYLIVKGKNTPVEVFEVRGYRKDDTKEWKEAEILYQSGLDLYFAKDFENAINVFKSVLKLIPDDEPAKLYIMRSQEYLLNPPPENWDKSYTLKTK